LGDDVDDAADRTVAVEHGARVAARDLDALNALARNRREIESGRVDVVDPSAIDQDQRIGWRRGAEAAHVDHTARAVGAAEQALHLHAGLARKNVWQVLRRRTLDVFGGYDGGRGAGDADCRDRARRAGTGDAEPARGDVENRQRDIVLRGCWAAKTSNQANAKTKTRRRQQPASEVVACRIDRAVHRAVLRWAHERARAPMGQPDAKDACVYDPQPTGLTCRPAALGRTRYAF